MIRVLSKPTKYDTISQLKKCGIEFEGIGKQKVKIKGVLFVKRLVLAWDTDFTKLTPIERKRLEEAENQIANGETVSFDNVKWDE